MLHSSLRVLFPSLAVIACAAGIAAQAPAVTTFPHIAAAFTDGAQLHVINNPSLTGYVHQLSADAGRSFGPATPLPALPAHYDLGWFADGNAVGYCFGTNLGPHVVRSSDGGATWSAPILISPNSIGTQRGSVWCRHGVLIACWHELRTLRGEAYAARSFDHGATWSNETRLSSPAIGVHPNGLEPLRGDAAGIYAVWLDGTTQSQFLQVSLDLGGSWLPAARAMPAGYLMSFACSGPLALAVVGSALHRSADFGATWTGLTPPVINGHPALAIDGQDVIFAITAPTTQPLFGFTLHTIASSDGGITWQAPSPNLLPVSLPDSYSSFLSLCLVGRSAALAQDWTAGGVRRPSVLLVTGDLGGTWTAQPPLGDHCIVGALRDGFWAAGTVQMTTGQVALLAGCQPYGAGTPGTGGVQPVLQASAAPCLGTATSVSIQRAVGGAPAVLAASFAGPDQRTLGAATVLVRDPVLPLWLLASGMPGVPAAGTATLPLTIPNDIAFAGLRVNWQGFVLDLGAGPGFSSTAGLEMHVQ